MSSVGVKGSDVFTHDEVGDNRVVLASLLVRGADETMIKEKLCKILEEGHVEDAFVLSFMNRNIRGGKGERDLFYTMYSILIEKKKDLAVHLLDLVVHYGYWRDLFVIAEQNASVKEHVLALAVNKLKEDEAHMEKKEPVSLLSKWIPREGKPLSKELANLISTKPLIQARLAEYRKRISTLNKYINTTEINMCSNHWSDIKPEKVSARCLKKHTKSFLNEKLKSAQLRHPDDKERNLCRDHFKEYFTKIATGVKVAKGADTLYPHEIVNKIDEYMNKEKNMKQTTTHNEYVSDNDSDNDSLPSLETIPSLETTMSDDQKNYLIGVWNAFVVNAREKGGLGRSIPMCDFSGSMCGLPLEVSRALGILISEVTTDAFKNKMLTFDSTPIMIDLPSDGTIFDKVSYINRNSHFGVGMSTDFQKAMDLVLNNLVKHRVPVGQEPENIIVLTDMAWDAAYGSSQSSIYTNNMYSRNVKTAPWQTHIQMIRENFKRAGEDMFGEGHGYKVPRIVIWNLSPYCQDMHAQGDTEGVVMLSGWSPAMFKVLMAKGVEIQTPYKALRYQLDDDIYNIVRERINTFLNK